MKKCVLLLVCVSLLGCATVAERYSVEKIIDGEKVKVDVLKIDGIGKGKYSDGTEIEGRPVIQFPQLPQLKYERD